MLKTQTKKIIAFMSAFAMATAMLLNFPGGFFSNIDWNLTASAAEGDVAINETTFPDANFRSYVQENCDTNSDGTLSVEEIAAVTSIDVQSKGITDLTGVEYFTALTTLNCGLNSLTSLDMSNNTELKYLACNNNQLTILNVSSNKKLTDLIMYWNQLTSLDLSNNTVLVNLNCQNSKQMTSLDVSGCTALTTLECYYNQLTSLDVSVCTALTKLTCYNNQLESLDVSGCTALSYLECNDNQLTNLDVGNNTALEYLYCESNQLTSLDVSECTALTKLDCHSNQLPSLDVSSNTALTNLSCYSNQLTSLDVSNNTALFWLLCGSNQLTSLNVSNNTALEWLKCDSNQLTSLDVSGCTALTSLECNSNQLTSLDVSNNTHLGTLYCSHNPLLAVKASKTININSYLDAFTAESFSICLADYGIKQEMISNLTGGIIKKGYLILANDTVTYTYDIDGENGTKTINCTISAPIVEINETTFPDANFRSYVQEYCDTSGDGILNAEEISEVTAINVNGMEITDLTGVEHFSALASLYCYNNQLTSLDVSNNTVLTTLYCYNNQLTSLDVSQNKVLTTLWCYSNQLTSLDVSKNVALKYLYCYDNQLTSLDVSKNTSLTKLNCKDNPLIAVNAAGSISTLYVSPLLPFTEKTTVICLADYGINADMVSDLQGGTIENGYLLVTDCIATYTYDIDGDLGTNTISCTITADNHTYDENGFCSLCGAYEPAEDANSDGYYEIGNAGQLYWFAEYVNGGNTGINAVLTDDITVNTGDVANCGGVKADGWIDWTPIGNSSNKYTGTFDGQGYTVSGLYFNDSDTSYVGLFGSVESGGKVSGVGIADSYFRGNDYVGGICGENGGTITNCYNSGVVIAVNRKSVAGGICGYNEGTITNCYNSGNISAEGNAALIGGVCAGNYGTVTNCYYLSETADENGGKTETQFGSGEVAYLLSQGENGEIWGQTIGTDSMPVMGGKKVLANVDLSAFANDIIIYGQSASLDGTIGFNIYVAANDDYANWTASFNGDEVATPAKDENGLYKFTYQVAAKDMDEKINFTVNDKIDVTVSVSKYLDELSETDNESLKNLAESMSAYGDASKAFFSGGTVAEQTITDDLSFYDFAVNTMPEGISYYGSSLLLESETTIRHYFTLAEGKNISDFAFMVGGKTATLVESKNNPGYYCIDIQNVSADELGTAFTVSINGEEVITNYSALSYANKVLSSDSTDDNLKNLVKALYLYNNAAAAYMN